MALQSEGPESTLVQDSDKMKCPYCGGTFFQVAKTGDEPEDVVDDIGFIALGVENASFRTAQIMLCHCGKEFCGQITLYDTYTFTGAETTPVGTNLDATVADGLAGWWFICGTGTDIDKYVAIVSNGIGTPTTITLAFAIADDADGTSRITNIEPIGLVKIVA